MRVDNRLWCGLSITLWAESELCEWAADFLGKRKEVCLSLTGQGAQLACSLLFVLIELHSTQLIPLCPPANTSCPRPQHLIRQLTPPSVVSAGGSAACQMLGWESLLFWQMNVFFFPSLSFVVLHSLEPESDHLANGLYFLSILYRLSLCRRILHLNERFCAVHLSSANQLLMRTSLGLENYIHDDKNFRARITSFQIQMLKQHNIKFKLF